MGLAHARAAARPGSAARRLCYAGGMRTYSWIHLGLALAAGLACELKITPEDTDTGENSTGAATDGATSTDAGSVSGTGSGGTQGSGGTATTTDGGTATATATSTTADPTATSSTSVGTSVGTSETSGSTTSNPDPVMPQPCVGEAVPIKASMIAYLESQIPPPPPPDTTTGGSSGTGGDPPSPQTVHVRLSDQALSCKDPEAILQCGPHWGVSITIPPEFQTPGLYHLTGPDVLGIGFETGADEGGGQCSFGAGTFSASFELIAIDDTEVSGRLCHVEGPIPFNFAALEGSFVAPRCP